jgi:hypothetical protein
MRMTLHNVGVGSLKDTKKIKKRGEKKGYTGCVTRLYLIISGSYSTDYSE